MPKPLLFIIPALFFFAAAAWFASQHKVPAMVFVPSFIGIGLLVEGFKEWRRNRA